MERMKQRISVWLCLLLVAPAILGCLPMVKMEAQANNSSVYFSWTVGPGPEYLDGVYVRTIKTEEGQKFRIGNFVGIVDNGKYELASARKNVTYASNAAGVAAVKSNGEITTKKVGAADITITYKNVKTICRITVVKKDSLGMNKYSTMKKNINALIKAYGKGIKASNQYKVRDLIAKVEKSIRNKVNNGGFKYKKTGSDYSVTYELVVPEMVNLRIISDKMYNYLKTNNPIGTNASKVFKISSISASGNSGKFTVTLSKKVTATHIFAINESTLWDTDRPSSVKSGKFPIYVQDKKTGHKYYGIATAIQGSSKLSVELYNLKLKKGKTYLLYGRQTWPGTMKNTWTKAKSFKAK